MKLQIFIMKQFKKLILHLIQNKKQLMSKNYGFQNMDLNIRFLWYNPAMDYKKIITIEPGKRSGKPCIRGTRMTVTDVLEYLAGGMTQEEILKDFPDLTADDIRACLAFAADRERKLAAIPE